MIISPLFIQISIYIHVYKFDKSIDIEQQMSSLQIFLKIIIIN